MSGRLSALVRVNYYAGQILSAEDFTVEQEYHRDFRRRHNRCLHGWGVACGLDVSVKHPDITISSGLALDCQGEEIVLPDPCSLSAPLGSRAVARLYVMLHWAEQLIEPTASLTDEESYARAIEASRVTLESDDPTAGHARRHGHGVPCGRCHGVPLARLEWERRRWRIDSRYKRCRVE